MALLERNPTRCINGVCYVSCYVSFFLASWPGFKIFVRKQNTQAHYTYTQLLGPGRVYELAITVCLNSILKYEKKPIFADVGAFIGHYACYVSKFLNYDLPVYALESNKEFCNDIKI